MTTGGGNGANEPELVLTPPAPVPVVAPEKATGLVPLESTQKSKLNEQVDRFIGELLALGALAEVGAPSS